MNALIRIKLFHKTRMGILMGLLLGAQATFAQVSYIDAAKTTTPPGGKYVVNLSGTVTTATDLLDYDTGVSFGSVIMTGGTYSSSASVDSEWRGAAGTPAFDHFEGFIDNSDGSGFTSTNKVFTFSGLDSSKTYIFTATGIRNTNTATNQSARYTIGGVESFTNTSTQTDGFNTVINGDYTELTSGTQDIAQWSGINVGVDGTFTMTWSQGQNNGGNSYLSAMSLAVIPEPSTLSMMLVSFLGVVLLSFKKKRR